MGAGDWSCAAPGSPTADRPGCGRTGGTSGFSPTWTAPPSRSTPSTVTHASIELAIRDLKEGSGLEHFPSGSFSANSAWLRCAVLAHNLIRWTATIGEPVEALTVARTVRTHILAVPARIVNRSGTLTLRAPARWPWADLFARRLATIRALPAPRADPPAAWRPARTHTGADNPHNHDPLDQHALTVAIATITPRIDSLSPSHLQREPDR